MCRMLVVAVLILAFGNGCLFRKDSNPNPAQGKATAGQKPSPAAVQPRITPDFRLAGKVVRANAPAQFVVLNFPIGRLPALQQKLDVYRNGMKVGEVLVTGPHLDDDIVADVTAGEAAVGDEVRQP